MVKSPAFQFYPADWLNDIKLQTCSLASQGLLLNLMCLMHQSEKYGYLLINGSIPSVIDVSHLLRLHYKTYQARLKELILNGVLCEGENGVVYSKRMIKDEHIRQVRREAGKLGGSPLLKQEVKQEVKQKSTPSSSTSPSPSSSKQSEQVPFHFESHVGEFLDDILSFCEKIKKLPGYKKEVFNPYMWVQVQTNNSGHPQAISESLQALIDYWPNVENPWTYGNKIMATKSGNYHEADHIKQHQEFKKAFDIDPRVKEFLKPIGGK